MVLSALTAIAFGLSPALRATKLEPVSAIKDDGSVLGFTVRRSRLRSLLIATQVTISVLFLAGAGLLIRGLLRSHEASVGFDARSSYLLKTNFGNDRAKVAALRRRLLERLQTLPELKNAALGHGPFFGTWTPPIVVDAVRDRTLASMASDTYFDTLGIDILRGRGFTKQEAEEGAPLAIISESTARRYWPDQDPLQKHFKLDLDFRGSLTEFEVVGVSKDVRFANPTRIDPVHVYLATNATQPNGLLFRIRGNPHLALAAVRDAVQAIDEDLIPNLELINLEQGPLQLQRSLTRAATLFVIILAFVAVAIATAGIYGVMTHIINQRVKEIGIRVALGATPRRVLRTVVLPELRPVFAGLVIGAAGGLGLSWLVHMMVASPGSSDLFSGTPFYDPITFLGLSCFIAAVSAIASFVPARRALKVDPAVALRFE